MIEVRKFEETMQCPRDKKISTGWPNGFVNCIPCNESVEAREANRVVLSVRAGCTHNIHHNYLSPNIGQEVKRWLQKLDCHQITTQTESSDQGCT